MTAATLKPRALVKRRAAVLEFIRHEVASGRPFPGTAAIARHMGWLGGSALDALYRLGCDGSIRKAGRCPRTGTITWALVVESGFGESESPTEAPAPPTGQGHGVEVGGGVGYAVGDRENRT